MSVINHNTSRAGAPPRNGGEAAPALAGPQYCPRCGARRFLEPIWGRGSWWGTALTCVSCGAEDVVQWRWGAGTDAGAGWRGRR